MTINGEPFGAINTWLTVLSLTCENSEESNDQFNFQFIALVVTSELHGEKHRFSTLNDLLLAHSPCPTTGVDAAFCPWHPPILQADP